MLIRKVNENDMEQCVKIAIGLVDWFDEKAVEDITKEVRIFQTYVYDNNGTILGFVCIKEKFSSALEIKWMGVDANSRHVGIGTKLIEYIENKLANGKVIMVKTLDDSSDYAPYVSTRAFYKKNGFVKIDVIVPYPGWSEDCPCAIYVKLPEVK